jgi:hypothetical protein
MLANAGSKARDVWPFVLGPGLFALSLPLAILVSADAHTLPAVGLGLLWLPAFVLLGGLFGVGVGAVLTTYTAFLWFASIPLKLLTMATSVATMASILPFCLMTGLVVFVARTLVISPAGFRGLVASSACVGLLVCGYAGQAMLGSIDTIGDAGTVRICATLVYIAAVAGWSILFAACLFSRQTTLEAFYRLVAKKRARMPDMPISTSSDLGR